MKILACSDIHSPVFYSEFVKQLEKINEEIDLIIFAGDMVERDSLEKEIEEYRKIYNSLFGKFSSPIIAVFGNTEFEDYREKIKNEITGIKFLDDQYLELKIGEKPILIFGTTGSLDEPTRWQKSNIPNINQIFKSRIEKMRSCFKNYSGFKILVTHYAPTYKTLEGENPLFYKNLGSIEMEMAILETKPNIVIHGHSHLGKRFAWIDTIPIFNVAFPVNKRIVIIDTDKIKPGLQKFV